MQKSLSFLMAVCLALFMASSVYADGGVDSYTKLMIHSTASDEPTVFVDSSDSGHTITRVGNTHHFSPAIGNSSMFFDGDGDYLSIPYSSDWILGTGGAFTIDAWIYPLSDCDTTVEKTIVSQYAGSPYHYSWRFTISGVGSGKFKLCIGTTTSNNYYFYGATSDTFPVNNWYHVVFTREESGWHYLYVNGVKYGWGSGIQDEDDPRQLAWNEDWTGIADAPLYVGARSDGTLPMSGYIDELRISKGIARWTENFTPVREKYESDGYTKLLIHSDETESSETFTDSSDSTHTITQNGDAIHVPVKFDNASIYFDGDGDYLSLDDSGDWDFETGDFTIDTWLYINDFGSEETIILSSQNDPVNSYGFRFGVWLIGGVNKVGFQGDYSGGYQIDIPGSTEILTNQWYHIAVVRSDGVIDIYLNGVKDTDTQTGDDLSINLNAMYIGYSYYNSSNRYLDGYLDELRISKGIARWTDDFTPPRAPYSVDLYPCDATFDFFTNTLTIPCFEINGQRFSFDMELHGYDIVSGTVVELP